MSVDLDSSLPVEAGIVDEHQSSCLSEGDVSISAITANILGIFQDPFEFAGDYGPEMNPTREKVFKLVMPQDRPSVPFSELIPAEILVGLEGSSVAQFLQDHLHENAFDFLRNSPKELLRLDKTLRDRASGQGQDLELSILSSSYPLQGSCAAELKVNLLNQLRREEIVALAKPLDLLDERYEVFQTPEGQVLFYWLYQSLNLHLVSQDPTLIQEINKTKMVFSRTLGNLQQRAEIFLEKALAAKAEILFTQESDYQFLATMTQKGTFLFPVGQNPSDGCFVFLKRDVWEENVQVIPVENYEGFQKGLLNLIVATHKLSGQKFLLASCHGHSTNPADGRLQISLVMKKFEELSLTYPGLQLAIGIDANTKTDKDVEDLICHLDKHGLVATQVGPTTVKKRMISVQHGKTSRVALDQEDYLIVLKPEKGGKFALSNSTVGFSNEPVNREKFLPNLENLSDHYPVGATLLKKG